jgi:hypothetical protein
MAERFRPSPAGAIILPMSRYDIADYLCIAVETVSRAITELRERRVIRFGDIRSVQICDRDALERLSEGSPAEEPTGDAWGYQHVDRSGRRDWTAAGRESVAARH